MDHMFYQSILNFINPISKAIHGSLYLLQQDVICKPYANLLRDTLQWIYFSSAQRHLLATPAFIIGSPFNKLVSTSAGSLSLPAVSTHAPSESPQLVMWHDAQNMFY